MTTSYQNSRFSGEPQQNFSGEITTWDESALREMAERSRAGETKRLFKWLFRDTESDE